MVRTVEHFPAESIVLVTAEIRRPPRRVEGATIHDAEFDVLEIHLLSTLTEHVPFTVYDAENMNRIVKVGDEESTESDDNEDGGESTQDDESKRGRSSLQIEDIHQLSLPSRSESKCHDVQHASIWLSGKPV